MPPNLDQYFTDLIRRELCMNVHYSLVLLNISNLYFHNFFRALALRLYCGNSESSTEHNETYAAFSFNIVLSDEGLKRVDEVSNWDFIYW